MNLIGSWSAMSSPATAASREIAMLTLQKSAANRDRDHQRHQVSELEHDLNVEKAKVEDLVKKYVSERGCLLMLRISEVIG
jgi:hypothetical protein